MVTFSGFGLTSLTDISACGLVRFHLVLHIATLLYSRTQCWARLCFRPQISNHFYRRILLRYYLITVWKNDTRIYIRPRLSATGLNERLAECLLTLHNWFCYNFLVVNSSKSQSIVFGTRHGLRPFHLSLQSVCGSIHYQLPVLRHIRPAISDSVAATLASFLVESRLDYANSLLSDTSAATH